MIYCKYVFPTIEEYNTLVNSLYNIEPENSNSFVVEEGSFLVLPQIEDLIGFHVDVIWHQNVNPSFNVYEVFPEPTGLHTVMGMESLYEHRYNEKMQSQAPE